MVGSKSMLIGMFVLLAQALSVSASQLTPVAAPVGLPAVVLAHSADASSPTLFTVTPLAGRHSGDVVAWRPAPVAAAQSTSIPGASYVLQWSAQQRMQQDERTAGARWSAQRSMFTWDRSRRTQVDLRWPLLPAHMQQQLLSSNPQAAVLGGEALVNYLRGDRSNEARAGLLPRRESLLGDTLASQPVIVVDSASSEAAQVIVGTASGVLHALDAASGQQRWAYLPSALVCLQRLPTATTCAQQSAKMIPASARVELWGQPRDVLVSGLGGAAPGWFALDVTPEAPHLNLAHGQAKPRVLWELGAQDDAGIGYYYGKPTIAELNDGQAYVVAGNGYNSERGEAALYLMRLADGQVMRLGTGSGSPLSRNGMSAPALVDSDFDGVVDRVYAGDVAGQLWKFDLSSSRAEDWGVAAGARPLFAAGPAHPILLTPEVTHYDGDGFLVYVATGHAGINGADEPDVGQLVVAVRDGLVTAVPARDLVLSKPQPLAVAGAERRVRTVKSFAEATTVAAAAWQVRLPPALRPTAPPRLRGGRLWVHLHDRGLRSNTRLALDYLHGGAPAGPSFDLNNDDRLDAADSLGDSVGLELGAGLWSSPTALSLVAGQDAHYSQHWSVNALVAEDPAPVTDTAPVVNIAAGPNFQPGRRSWIDISAD